MSTITVRTDEKLKRDAQKVLEEIGLDISTAIKMYLHQIVLTESIPFPIRTANGFTVEQEREMLKEMEEALAHGKRYDSAGELHRTILGDAYDHWKERSVPNRRDKAVSPRSSGTSRRREVRRRKTR